MRAAQALHDRGLNPGRAGNVSVRFAESMLITPSGVPYPTLVPSQIVEMGLDGSTRSRLNPSSEWRFHRDLYVARPDVQSVVHTHSTFATALSVLRAEVPAFHYMVAVAGGSSIRCARYATFGSQELSDNVLEAIAGRSACLLANHGLVTVASSLEAAMGLAAEVEALSEVYVHARAAGDPIELSRSDMADALFRFEHYGNPALRAQRD